MSVLFAQTHAPGGLSIKTELVSGCSFFLTEHHASFLLGHVST